MYQLHGNYYYDLLFFMYVGYDTQSLKVEFDRRFPRLLCVTCHLASWSKDQTMCKAKIHSLEPRYKDKGKTCFELSLDMQYKVNVTVSDGRLTFNYALLGGTLNDPTTTSSDDHSNNPRKPLAFYSCSLLILCL